MKLIETQQHIKTNSVTDKYNKSGAIGSILLLLILFLIAGFNSF